MKKGKNKIKIIIIIIGIFLIVGGIILLLFLPKEEKKKEKEEAKEVVEEALEKILMEYGQILESTILEALSQSGTLLTYNEARNLSTINSNVSVSCDVTKVYENGKLYLEGCEINGKKISATYGTKQEDAPVKQDVITVYERNGYYNLKRPEEDIDKYRTYKISTGVPYELEKIVNDNVSYQNATTKEWEMRNIKTGEKVLSNISYTSIFPIRIDNQTYDKNIVSLKINGKWGFYQLSDGKEIVPPIYNAVEVANCFLGTAMGYEDAFYALNYENYILVKGDQGEGIINYTNNSIIIPPQYKDFHSSSGKLLWNENVIFDYYGNAFLKGKYDKIYGVVENYVLVQQGENIKLLKIDGEELYNYNKQVITKPSFTQTLFEGKLRFEFGENKDKCTIVIYDFEKKAGKIEEGKSSAVNIIN